MTLLRPMPAEAFGAYQQASIIGYAEDKVAVGSWPAAGALERSREEFASLLPQGLATPDNHIFEILAADVGPVVGAIWLAIEHHQGVAGGYIYNVEIHPEHRRRGHALRAFEAIEPLAAALGATNIGLHVFGQNHAAQALYRKLGYQVTGINMRKTIAPMIAPTIMPTIAPTIPPCSNNAL